MKKSFFLLISILLVITSCNNPEETKIGEQNSEKSLYNNECYCPDSNYLFTETGGNDSVFITSYPKALVFIVHLEKCYYTIVASETGCFIQVEDYNYFNDNGVSRFNEVTFEQAKDTIVKLLVKV